MNVEQRWKGRRVVRWTCTQWCNFKCHYCRQDHSRHQLYSSSGSAWVDNATPLQMAKKSGHWADNGTVDRWLDGFQRHFGDSQCTLTITGGEALLDRKNFEPLLQRLVAEQYVECVRIDTNNSWRPYGWTSSKIVLMVSYHPSETGVAGFWANLDRTLAAGWNVVLVTVVMVPEYFAHLSALHEGLRIRGIALAAMPVFGTLQYYDEAQVAAMRKYVPAADWHFRTGGSTKGRSCLYPSIAYEVDPDGTCMAACFPRATNVLTGPPLPLPPSYVLCPHNKCTCTDRYTFLEELDVNLKSPIESFAERAKEHASAAS